MAVLEEREFVRRRPTSTIPGEREYTIKHALTREVAYESLPRARRAQLHAEFAAWLDRRMDGRDELAPLVAHHYAAAVRPEDLDLAWPGREGDVRALNAKAVEWSRKAGDLAIGRYEIDDGISLLSRAVEQESDPAAKAGLWYAIGHASALKYDGEGFVAAMERAPELGAPPGEVYTELALQWSHRSGMWKVRLDDELTLNWVERAVAESPDGTPTRVRALVAQALGNSDVAAARAALALAERLGDLLGRADSLGALESALVDTGEFREALDVASMRLDLLPEIRDPDRVADVLFANADLYLRMGRLAGARAMTERMEETVAGLTPHHRVHGLEVRVALEDAVGDLEALRRFTPQAEEAIAANLATPCPFNASMLVTLRRPGPMQATHRKHGAS